MHAKRSGRDKGEKRKREEEREERKEEQNRTKWIQRTEPASSQSSKTAIEQSKTTK
jgi:hypothetical protein